MCLRWRCCGMDWNTVNLVSCIAGLRLCLLPFTELNKYQQLGYQADSGLQWRQGQEMQQRCLCCTETRCRCFCLAFQVHPHLGLHVELPDTHLWIGFRQIKVLLVIAQPLSADQRRGEWSFSPWNLTIQLVFYPPLFILATTMTQVKWKKEEGVWIPSMCIMSRFMNARTLSSLKYFNFLLIYISGVEM